jgi:hypothetical protein
LVSSYQDDDNGKKMISTPYRSARSFTFIGFLALLLFGAPASAALVHGVYLGTVEIEGGGFGLLGQTFRADITYDTDTIGTPTSLGSNNFNDAVKELTVSIGQHQWTWNATDGTSSIELRDGPVDHFEVRAKGFTGPDLSSTPTAADSYQFFLDLYDLVPDNAPNGVSDQAVLPSIAPDPDLFEPSPSGKALVFQITGAGLLMTTTFSAAPVPIPAAALLLGGALAVLPAFRRRAPTF